MRNDEIAKDFITDAERSMKEANDAYENGFYHRTVRRSQEAVELSLKALLRFCGIEYPKKHDVSGLLKILAKKLELKGREVNKISEISSRLTEVREPAFYGTRNRPPRELFSKKDAELALEDAKYVLKIVRRIVKQL